MTSYTPYVPAAKGASTTITGDNAAHVAESVLDSPKIRDQLGMGAAPGIRFLAINLGAATTTGSGLTRLLTVEWQPLPTVIQEQQGITPAARSTTIYLQHGTDDPEPGQTWQWALNGQGKLEPIPCPAP